MCKDPDLMPVGRGLGKGNAWAADQGVPDALLNRLLVVPYYPISKEVLQRIIKLNLSRIERRVLENQRVPFTYDQAVLDLIGKRCTELERGARMVDALITNTLLPEIGREFLNRLASGSEVRRVHVGATDKDFTFAFD
jgi:type VI secretion system protein VasG